MKSRFDLLVRIAPIVLLTSLAACNPGDPETDKTLEVVLAGAGTGTVEDDAGGISRGAECKGTYAEGEEITLTAAPDPGSVFVRWLGACSGTQTTCTVELSENKFVTAEFGLPLPKHKLTVTLTGLGGGIVTSSPAGISCAADCD
jgi:hypothetical protein